MDDERREADPGAIGTVPLSASPKRRSGLSYFLIALVVLFGCGVLGLVGAGALTFFTLGQWGGPGQWEYVATRSRAPQTAKSIAFGGTFTAVVLPDSTLWSWGQNRVGQLGQGSVVDTVTRAPARVGTEADWSTVVAGQDHALALKSDGTLAAWGLNTHGQLGEGTLTRRSAPVPVGTAKGWTQVAAGTEHSLALMSDGTLWAWGLNDRGQLGDGTTVDRTVPTQVGTDTDWASVAAGGSRTLAIKSDGSLWAWGDNTKGLLGFGDSTPVLRPARVGRGSDWASVSLAEASSIGVMRDGTLWVWQWSPLDGYGVPVASGGCVPTRLGTSTDWRVAGAGRSHAVAVKTDGSLWAWGGMRAAAFERGYSKEPQRVGTDTDWQGVVADSFPDGRTSGIKSDGTVWWISQR